MPSASKHETKAASNRRFLDGFRDTTTAADWAAVVAFYTAVHLVERIRALENDHSRDHRHRNEYILRNHRTIHADFHGLYNVSLLARYESNDKFYKQLTPEQVWTVLVDQYLLRIEEYVKEFCSKNTTKPSTT